MFEHKSDFERINGCREALKLQYPNLSNIVHRKHEPLAGVISTQIWPKYNFEVFIGIKNLLECERRFAIGQQQHRVHHVCVNWRHVWGTLSEAK
jgi:hypothetical protein